MYRTIIVGFDGSDQARDALAFAGALAKGTEAKVIAANVFQYQGEVPLPGEGEWLRFLRADAEQTVGLAQQAGMVEPDRLETKIFEAGSPARGLHHLAEEVDADLIVVGSSHRGRVGEVLAGSVGQRLLHGSSCPVAVAPSGLASRGLTEIGQIVVAFDGSAEAQHALEGAAELAESTGARIRLAVVAEPPPIVYGKGAGATAGAAELEKAIEQYMQAQLDSGLRSASSEAEVEGSVLRGEPVERLREAAADADVLVMGSRGYGPLRAVLLGSISAHLVRSAPCTVMVYPRGVEAPEAAEAERKKASVG